MCIRDSIYYASGETVEQIDRLPQTELLKEKGYEILYLTDSIDEFALQVMREFDEKQFKSVSGEDLDLSLIHIQMCIRDRGQDV